MTSVVTEGVPFGTQIRRIAEADPDGIGVIFAAEDGTEREVTWRELDERSTQLAHVFVEEGLTVGDILAVCIRNSPEHLMACFAGWKAGAAVVPMRWDLPEWERGRVLATMKPKLIVDADHLGYIEESLVGLHDAVARRRAPTRLGRVQLGVDRDAQGHHDERRGCVLRRDGHEHDCGIVRRIAAATTGPGPCAALPHQRVHGDEEPDGRRDDRPARAFQCGSGSSISSRSTT